MKLLRLRWQMFPRRWQGFSISPLHAYARYAKHPSTISCCASADACQCRAFGRKAWNSATRCRRWQPNQLVDTCRREESTRELVPSVLVSFGAFGQGLLWVIKRGAGGLIVTAGNRQIWRSRGKGANRLQSALDM